jgi:FkbM family methyltransferase
MITTVHEHYVDTKLLQPGGWILDLGCAGFENSTYFVQEGFKVVAVEPARYGAAYVPPPQLLIDDNFHMLPKACVGLKESDTMTFYEYGWGGANSLYMKPEMLNQPKYEGHGKNPFKTSYEVELTTISEIMNEFNIEEFEYIKFDIEGAEYQILENLPKNCTKQFSVEFHDFFDLSPDPENPDRYHDKLNSEILTDYEKVIERRGWRNNIDDCLYVRKDLV